jgi:chromosome segregation protein
MKLRSLTVSGFKSFADKTSFDFDDGVTCVVGPNGCGKSNVIDAFKWVLGEQSAKSLRGGQMQDVIFNGTAQRRAAGFAEVKLTFEDVAGVLGTDAAAAGGAVSIARRLYRSGESEYLVNNQPARLKDIREMFLDTGAGLGAYSLIEQGRVEGFLQASPQDRRLVFDEAAGISRYKARRRDAQRRLERVEQNLLRLQDVLDEVAKRLRSIKQQAGKARSYQAYSQRLRELRSMFALAEYHRFGQDRRQLQGQVDALTDELASFSSQIDHLQAARSAGEVELADVDRAAHELDGRILTLSGQITQATQRAEMLETRAKELEEEIAAESKRREGVRDRQSENAAELERHREQLRAQQAALAELTARHQQAAERHADIFKHLNCFFCHLISN